MTPTIYDEPRNLLNVMGTFWSLYHPDPQGPEAIVEGVAQLGRQQARFLEDATKALSRELIPLLRQDDWYWLELSSVSRLVAADGWFEWPIPSAITAGSVVVDKIIAPTIVLGLSSDFEIGRGVIRFRVDPLSVLPNVVADDGTTSSACWLYAAQCDFNDLYNQFGYAVGLQAVTSRTYKKLLNAVYDAIVSTPTMREITLVISAATGIPVVRSDNEVVTLITQGVDRLLIVTDKEVYNYPATAVATVAIGDIVQAGDSLTDALFIQMIGAEDLPNTVVALAIDEGLMASCFRGGLIFDNRLLPLEVDTNHISGFTKVRWALGGRRDDVDLFFDTMHNRGVAEALSTPADCLPDSQTYQAPTPTGVVRRKKSTLAHLLDMRPQSYGEPSAANLPAQINPCQFMTRNVLRDHAIFASVKLAGTHREAAGLLTLALQKILPPEQTLILQVALTPLTESITVANVDHTLASALALPQLSDETDDDDVDDVSGYILV